MKIFSKWFENCPQNLLSFLFWHLVSQIPSHTTLSTCLAVQPFPLHYLFVWQVLLLLIGVSVKIYLSYVSFSSDPILCQEDNLVEQRFSSLVRSYCTISSIMYLHFSSCLQGYNPHMKSYFTAHLENEEGIFIQEKGQWGRWFFSRK